MGRVKGKVTWIVNQLKVSVPDFIELAAEGGNKELDKAALEISNRWERLEMGIREFENTTV